MEEVSENPVRTWRIMRGMTQTDLAKKAKLSPRTIHSVEKGNDCRMNTKRQIIIAFGMDFREGRELLFPSSLSK